mgnify:CR=1 FL=1
MDKNKLREQINTAYNMISGIYVKGPEAKRMALAMQLLENVFAELDKPDAPLATETEPPAWDDTVLAESEVVDG